MSIPFINRSDLIEQLAQRLEIDNSLSEQIVKIILGKMVDSLKEGNRIEIRGFGSFELRHRKSRMARNPKTGEKTLTEDRYAVHFKPGKEMKNKVNRK